MSEISKVPHSLNDAAGNHWSGEVFQRDRNPSFQKFPQMAHTSGKTAVGGRV